MKYRIESTTTGFKVRAVSTNTKGKETTRIIGRTTSYDAVDSIIEKYERTLG